MARCHLDSDMATSDALWNEVVRIINREFVMEGELLTPELLLQLIKAVDEMLND